MAAEPTTNSNSSPVDVNKHREDYGLLISMLKWGGVVALLTGFLVMIILAN